ncbi:MAG: hypothetical protein JJ971_04630 [Balneolaceae bacterium]|nr:hypothetical protein [Balneolaceae bacterium]MBO6545661.1 hypothetical protein [Balneolaceae bacterium]MBO6647057.1 hypothetical protein [Balneolaceae bacterium]
MRSTVIIISSILLLSCKSSHKLTGTDYVDLSMDEIVNPNPGFPQEIADSLGWGDLTSAEMEKVDEEFRFSLTSEYEPHYLYKISVKRKVSGESILYWAKSRGTSSTYAHQNMRQFLKGKCTEFFETENYGYCKPEYLVEPDWGNIYSKLEDRNIWQLPGPQKMDSLNVTKNVPDSIRWVMKTQMRLKDYYRAYTHTNPEQYFGSQNKVDLMAIMTQLQLISTSHQKPENFNLYSGVTTGARGSAFMLCDESQTWRFEGDLEQLLKASGYPATIAESENQFFYITVSGEVEDEWYGYRGRTGFTKVIRPSEVNNMVILADDACPARAP